MKITANYSGSMRFEGGEGVGRVVMDAAPEVGGLGEAHSPKQLVLMGLAGCTGMDVAAILAKKKVAYERFSIDVEAAQTRTHPRVFKQITITYRFVGDPAIRPDVERAVTLSRDQFCGVSAMLSRTAQIDTRIEVVPHDGAST